ncbi:glycosyltransferase family 61 protein [Bremerella cremea]|nr:glycosyltransferase family 61 protein [Bremerella cremea]
MSRVRALLFRYQGMAPPAKVCAADDWIVWRPTLGSIKPLDPPEWISVPARQVFGSQDEIAGHLSALPETTRTEFERLLFGHADYTVDEGRMIHMKSPYVFGRNVAVITSEGEYNLEDLGTLRFANASPPDAANYVGHLPRPRKLSGSLGVLAFGACSGNYYHFLIDCLPKLRHLEMAGARIDRYYAPFRYDFNRQLFKLWGIPASRIVPARELSHVTAEDVYVPQPLELPRPADMRYLFETMARQPWNQLDGKPQRRIYISRASARFRRVINEAEVVTTLARQGFQAVQLEGMPLVDQIKLFQQAAIIVAPHGAGLANMVFSPPGATVVEIGTVHRPLPFFQRLSAVCGHRFAWFVARSEKLSEGEANLNVDVRQLETDIEALLQPASVVAPYRSAA